MCVLDCLCACPLIMLSICLELINSGLTKTVKYTNAEKQNEKKVSEGT